MNRKTISSADKTKGQTFGGFKSPKLKGHLKVSLRDVVSGETKVIEGDNIVTNALSDIIAKNYLGAVNYNSMLPLYAKWFGGLLCFKSAFATTVIDGNTVPDPADYYIQGDNVNELIAHAGDVAPSTAEVVNEDLKRGSPVDIYETANSIKFTWDFTTRQGNGIISALALTHVDAGNAGIGNTSTAFKNLVPFAQLQSSDLASVNQGIKAAGNAFVQYDDNHTLFFYINEDGWYDYTKNITATKKVTIYIRNLPYNKAGLFDVASGGRTNIERKFAVETHFGESDTSFFYNPCYYFDYTNKYLWLFDNNLAAGVNIRTWSTEKVYYTVIDCNDGVADADREIDHGYITNDDPSNEPFTFLCSVGQAWEHRGEYYSTQIQSNIIIDGNYIYLPVGVGVNSYANGVSQNCVGFKKINLNNNSDSSFIPFEDGYSVSAIRSMLKNGGILIGQNFVINGAKGYQSSGITLANAYERTFINEFGTPSVFATVRESSDQTNNTKPRYILANKLIETTKFNLPSAVEKTATQAMTVEYTLTEV